MTSPLSNTGSTGDRPRTEATAILVPLSPEDLAALDAYVASADAPSRPQAVHAILVDWLRTHGFRPGGSHPKPHGPATEAVEAMDAAIKKDRRSKRTRDVPSDKDG